MHIIMSTKASCLDYDICTYIGLGVYGRTMEGKVWHWEDIPLFDLSLCFHVALHASLCCTPLSLSLLYFVASLTLPGGSRLYQLLLGS
jgi:hypothetical protein